EMQEKYESVQKDLAIADLAQANAIQSAKTQRRRAERNGALLGILALLLSLWGITQWARQRNKRQQAEARSQQLEHQQEVAALLQGQEVATLQAQLAGEDRERRRIGVELHDRVGSLLTATRLFVQAEVVAPEHRLRATTLLEEAQTEVRRLSHAMQEEGVRYRGLQASIQQLGEVITASGQLQVDVHLTALPDSLPFQFQRQVYRMVQELISNVLRHANAQEITLQINQIEELLVITVEDDGQGFVVGTTEGGLGLASVRQQVESLTGRLMLDSQPGHGTTVILQVPLPEIPELAE
ncbi:MAG: sensor histidine kinase, partial [Bacteroidota bacterium]